MVSDANPFYRDDLLPTSGRQPGFCVISLSIVHLFYCASKSLEKIKRRFGAYKFKPWPLHGTQHIWNCYSAKLKAMQTLAAYIAPTPQVLTDLSAPIRTSIFPLHHAVLPLHKISRAAAAGAREYETSPSYPPCLATTRASLLHGMK